MHTLEENIVRKTRSQVKNVMTTVETVDAVLSAVKNLVIPEEQMAMKTANASLGQSLDGNVMELDQMYFLGNFEGLQLTASRTMNSRRDISRIHEIRGEITAKRDDSLANESQ